MNVPKFVYFTTGEPAADARARKAGVRLRVAGEEKSGTLFTREAVGPCDLQEPAGAVWRELEPGTWCAVDEAAPLVPDRFWRGESFSGHAVEIGGAVWKVPAARLTAGGSGLPSVRVLGEDGKPAWRVKPEHRDLAVYAEELFDRMLESGRVLDAEGDTAVALALGVGYRMGMAEWLLLEVLTPEACAGVVKAVLDLPTVEAAAKAQKKTAGISGTCCGGEGQR